MLYKTLFAENKLNFHFVWEFASAWKFVSQCKLFEVILFYIVLWIHIKNVEKPRLAHLHTTFALFWKTCDLLQRLLNVALE